MLFFRNNVWQRCAIDSFLNEKFVEAAVLVGTKPGGCHSIQLDEPVKKMSIWFNVFKLNDFILKMEMES